ncbi:MAG: Crp/Fnr family transcriptional regulator [Gammaproteobacteria bacterium]|nr:Crp/Fnr family transcriptional regulator [Gammaproteobacteria bacterium]
MNRDTIQLSQPENNVLSGLFDNLSAPPEISTVSWHRQRFSRGDHIMQTDQPCDRFVIIGEGRIRLQLVGNNQRELTLYRINDGGVCLHSLFNLLGRDDYRAEAIAETDGWLVWSDKKAFQNLLDDQPAFRHWILANMSEKFADVLTRLQQLAFSPVGSRVADFLIEKMDHDSNIALTQQEIANELGTAREVVNRQLAKMEQGGLISRSRGLITVQDISGLLALTEDD